ncbi:MAG: phage terminase large subunit, partial [Cyanobacteria bacterium]|nr:phage terminase large subunit [Cyanobacteriota bacterium]
MIPIAYKLLPAQKQFIHIPNPHCKLDVCVYQGGYGSGKTFVGSFLGIELSEKYPGNRGLVVAKTYPLVRDTTLQAYFEHFENYGYRHGKEYIWKATESKVIFPNGSEILFRHLDAPYKLKSLNLGWVHMEEMSEMGEASFLMLLSRLRLKKVHRHRLFGTTNPQPNKGWIYRYFVENKPTETPKIAQSQQSQSEQTFSKPITIQYRSIVAPSTETVHLSPEYLENMKNQFDSVYDRIKVLGQDAAY